MSFTSSPSTFRAALVVCIVSVLPFGAGYAQTTDAPPGYLVTQGGDTLRGLVVPASAKQRLHQVAFRTNDSGEVLTFRAADVQEVGVEGEFLLHSRVVSGWVPATARAGLVVPAFEVQDTLLVEVLVIGPVPLYQAEGWRGQARFFLQDEGQKAVALYEQNYLGVLAAVFADCSEVEDVRRRTTRVPRGYRYESRDLSRLVARYNECVLPGAVVAAFSARSWHRLHVGFRTNVSHDDLWMGNWWKGPNGFELHPGVGVGSFASFEQAHPSSSVEWRVEAVMTWRRSRDWRRRQNVCDSLFCYYRDVSYEASALALDLPFVLRFFPSRPERRIRGFMELGSYGAILLDQQIEHFRFTAPSAGMVGGTGVVWSRRFEMSLRAYHSLFGQGRRVQDGEPVRPLSMRGITAGLAYYIR